MSDRMLAPLRGWIREMPEGVLRQRDELLAMLTYMRPCGSLHEKLFVNRFIRPLGVDQDEAGNLWKVVGKGSPILWSSHVDTVHIHSGLQKVLFGAQDWVATSACLGDGSPAPSCLGGDCTTGVWLMVNMIRAGVPGTYVFHYGEEVGCVGSKFVASRTPARLQGIKFAIAFDRRGTGDIVTHQCGVRTCSDAFAESLAGILNGAPELCFAPSREGVFTDTREYADIVPECSNVSIGYHNAHSEVERQDVQHAILLLDRLVSADFSRLDCVRDPAVLDREDSLWASGRGRHKPSLDLTVEAERKFRARERADLEDFCFRNWEVVAEFLEAQGFSLRDIEDFIDGYVDLDSDIEDDEPAEPRKQ